METSIAITESQKIAFVEITKNIQKAIDSWVLYNNTGGKTIDESEKYYNKAEELANKEVKKLNCSVEFDYPGLYPCYMIRKNGKLYTEYTLDAFFKRINGYYD